MSFKMENNATGKSVFFLLLVGLLVGFLGVASATVECTGDFNVSIDYAYGSSGINIGPAGTTNWIPGVPVVLDKGINYTMKAAVKNNLEEDVNGVHIIFMLDDTVLGEFDKSINTVTRPSLDFDISGLECNSTHSVSVEIQKDGDCDFGDNFASIDVYVVCPSEPPSGGGNETQPSCGDGMVNQESEECDDGNKINGDGCSKYCKEEQPKDDNDGNVGISVDVTTEDFEPMVWMCDHRVVYDDNTEPGRETQGGEELIERINNYAFEGEQIQWHFIVMDKNGKEKIEDVFATIGDSQGEGNDIEVNCQEMEHPHEDIMDHCNARILEEKIEKFDPETMKHYECTLTVETPLSMYGEYWITVEAVDLDGLSGTMDENEYWFLNPEIRLAIQGDLLFEDIRPGTDSYSDTILVGNDADMGSGVMLDMFISGTDFYDSTSSGAMCPTTNQLALKNFRYFVTSGVHNSKMDDNMDTVDGDRNTDDEGYTNIDYGIGFNDPAPFYDNMEILQTGFSFGPYWTANTLAPGAEMAITFKLSLPEPCNGDFDTGSIYFWGEAI